MLNADASVQALISYLEHEPTPMIVLDVDYNILAANTAYQRQFAVPRQEVRGQKCFRVSHQYSVPCDQAGEHCPLKQALATRAPDRVLHIHHTPRGPEHVDVELRPILDAAGAVIAYVERLTSIATASAQPREDGLVGRAEAFNQALAALQRAAPSQIPVLLQVKLLRLIESGTFRRVGGVDTLRADFRLVAATHKPLRQMVDAGTFRQDLYYRISAFPVHLPPLRDRKEDIPLLAQSLLRRLAGGAPLRLDDEALEALRRYAFPGNVRELRNLLERARLFADEGVIRLRDLPPEVAGVATPASPRSSKRGGDEKARLSHALAVFDGTRAELARHLGWSERTLYRRLKAHGLE